MKQCARRFRWISAALVMAAALASAPSQADSMKEQLVGAWIMTRADSVAPDGTRTEAFGANPKGIMIFSGDGHFALIQMKNDIPRIQANARDKGTPEEYKAIVAGSIAYYGTYAVNETEKTINLKLEAGTFANVVALGEQSRVVTLLTADELQFRNARTPSGAVLEVAFKRAR